MDNEEDFDIKLRIGLLFALVGIGAVSTLLPICLSLRWKSLKEDPPRKKIILSVLSCFAGGVFLAVTFLHLIPDLSEIWESILLDVWQSDYPLDKFLIAFGFFIILLIEQIAYSCQTEREKIKKVAETEEFDSHVCRPDPTPRNIVASISITAPPSSEPLARSSPCRQCEEIHKEENHPRRGHAIGKAGGVYWLGASKDDAGGEDVRFNKNEENRSNEDEVEKTPSPSNLRAILLAMVLSIHSVFEGLAFGLIGRSADAIELFLGIAIHRCIIGVSLGVAFVSTKTKPILALALSCIFVLSNAIGISIGIGIKADFTDNLSVQITSAVLQALACGTFIYITFLELIGQEFSNMQPEVKKHRLLLVFACILGFTLLASITFIHS